MDTEMVSDLLREAVLVALKLSAPMLILSLVVGVIVAILQAVTQIHEQSISFIFKLIVVVAVLVIGGGWMLEVLQEYTLTLFSRMT